MADTKNADPARRLRLGFVGGGPGSIIGRSHSIGARMDQAFDIVAGCFSRDPARTRAMGGETGIEADRCYADYAEMARCEAQREDPVDLVSVLTPNDSHYAVCREFLDHGFDVFCEKPLTLRSDEAWELEQRARDAGRLLFSAYTYSGYPMVREARERVRSGAIGDVRVVNVEYPMAWMSRLVEHEGEHHVAWRSRPERVGPSLVLMDLGTHAFHLGTYVVGAPVTEVSAQVSTLVPGRTVDDNAHVLMRFANGAMGSLWASTVAAGNEHGLSIRVHGSEGGLEWRQEEPNHLWQRPLDEPARLLARAAPGLSPLAARSSRVMLGHPEGYFEAYANLYRDIADRIREARLGGPPEPLAGTVPDGEAGATGVAFVEAAMQSSRDGGRWTSLRGRAGH